MNLTGALREVGGWVTRRAIEGDRRTQRLLRLVARAWKALVPDPLRLRLEHLGRLLLLDARLTPAVAAIIAYPLVDRIGPWGTLVLVFVPIALWGHAVAGRRLSIRRQMLGAGAFFVVVFLTPVALAWNAPDWWTRVGEISGWTFRAGIYGLVFTALVLGLVIALAWAIPSPSAAVAVGAGLGGLVALCMFIGLSPGWELMDLPAAELGLGGWNGVAAGHGGAALVGAIAFLLARRWDAPAAFRRPLKRFVPAAAITAWLLPWTFAYAALTETVEKTNIAVSTSQTFESGLLPHARPASLTPDELMRAYRPLLMLHRNERWIASSVDAYVKGATLWRLRPDETRGEQLMFDGTNLPTRCRSGPEKENPAPAAICFVLVGDCPEVSSTCDRGHASTWPEETRRLGRVYARVVVRDRQNPFSAHADGSPPVFREPLPFRDLHAVVQYWLFFRNNLWRTDTAVGRMVQRHQADWEQVTIGLSPSKPLFMAYSSHCGGRWLDWNAVRTIRGPDGEVRPIVWIARGSHAIYPDPTPREPDFLSCRKGSSSRDGEAVALLVYAANVRETLPSSSFIQDPRSVRVDAHRQPFSFPGRWTAESRVALVNRFRETTLPPASKRASEADQVSGPETPPCKQVWKDPLAVIFCGEHWHPKDHCTPSLKARLDSIPRGCI